jgi:membrane protein implicated in regulation of membrane protease activity
MADVGPDFRKSDRYVTPGVIIAALIIAGILLAVVAGSVAYLTAQGIDPDPMLKLVATVGGGLFSLGTFILQLVNRPTAAKTERNTGVLAAHTSALRDTVGELAAATAPAPAPATSSAMQLPPVPSAALR